MDLKKLTHSDLLELARMGLELASHILDDDWNPEDHEETHMERTASLARALREALAKIKG